MFVERCELNKYFLSRISNIALRKFYSPQAFKLNNCSDAFFAGNHDAANAIMSAVSVTKIKSVITNLTGK